MSQALIVPALGGASYDWSNDHMYVKAPQALTDRRLTLVEDQLKPGFHLPRHHHRLMTEIFYILEGEVRFAFDDEIVTAAPGTTINIPTRVWHEVTCAHGARLLTIFSPGGFDEYLAELAALTPAQNADAAFQTALAEKYDTWTR